jgi:hypothetical protein
MQYPSDWEKLGMMEQLNIKNLTPVLTLASPDKSAFFSVTIEKVNKNTTLNQEVASLKRDIPNIKIIESNTTTLAGIPAHKLVFSGTIPFSNLTKKLGLEERVKGLPPAVMDLLDNLHYKSMHIFAIEGDKEYNLVYQVRGIPEQYSLYLPTVQKMIDSFQITQHIANPTPKTNGTQIQCGDLLNILNNRLVNGSITTGQYDVLREKIGC